MSRGGKTQWLSNEVEQASLEDGANMGPVKVAIEWAVEDWRRGVNTNCHKISTKTSIARLWDWLRGDANGELPVAQTLQHDRRTRGSAA